MIDSDIFIHLFLTDIILMIYNYLKANTYNSNKNMYSTCLY